MYISIHRHTYNHIFLLLFNSYHEQVYAIVFQRVAQVLDLGGSAARSKKEVFFK